MIKLRVDIPTKIMEVKKQLKNTFKVLKENNFRSKIVYLKKISLKLREINTFRQNKNYRD